MRELTVDAAADSGRTEDRKAALFREHYPALRRMAQALVSDPHLAEEFAQEAFVRAWRKLDRLADEPPAAARAYLRTTLLNLVRRSFRRRMLEIRQRFIAHDERMPGPDHAARLAVTDAVQQLPPRQRACVVLRYLEDLPEKETAEILGVSVGTVKSQTHRALARLAEILGDDEPDE